MRLLTVAVLAFSLAAVPAMAQTAPAPPGQPANIVHPFGSIGCPQHFRCDTVDSAELVANANACVTRYMMVSNPDGFFDATAGLDSNNCLKPIPNSTQKGLAAQLEPHCCEVQLPDEENMCAFGCQQVPVK